MKKFLQLSFLVAIFILSGAVLSGCVNDKQVENSGRINDEAIDDQAIIEPVIETSTDDGVTDVSIESDLNDLDEIMDSVKTTGFESDNLADKDLGL